MPCWRCRARPSFPQNKQALAYLDLDLDVSEGGAAKRFLIKPVVLAKMLQAAEIKETRPRPGGRLRHRIRRRRDRPIRAPGDRDRERFGAGGQGAALAWPAMACGNVTVRPRRRPMATRQARRHDVIVLNGATEIVPERLCGQLRNGGRLVGVFADITAGAGHHRDRFAWRFRSPDAVRCRCPGTARHGTSFRPSFSSVSAVSTPNIRLRGQLNPLRNQKCGPFAPREEVSTTFACGVVPSSLRAD